MVSGDLPTALHAMAVCHLPQLALDRPVPQHVLERRGAISFSSSTSLFKSLPRLERRGGISLDKTDKAAIYVRMLGDVRVKSKQLMSHVDGRRSSLPDNEIKIIEAAALDNNVRRTSLNHCREWSLPRGYQQQPNSKPRRRMPPDRVSLLDNDYCGQANQLLSRLWCWDFNIFHLEQVTGGHSLRFVGMQLFQKYDLIHTFHLDPANLYKCLVAIETGYHFGNPYHNALHAADVTQAMFCYLRENKLREHLTPLEVMVAILASATHDLDHPGVNQVFLIATSNHLADLYGNSSVLENHHWRAAISILRESKLFDHLDKKLWDYIVKQIRSLILATDIGRQQEFLQNLKNHLNANDFDLRDPTHKSFILQIALKCADICNPCRKWDLSHRWSEMVTQEFFNQGDRERGLELPLTMNCDRYKNTIQQIQAGFMKFVVEPLFNEWSRFIPTGLSAEMLANLSKNKALWEAYAEREKAGNNENEWRPVKAVTGKPRKIEAETAAATTAVTAATPTTTTTTTTAVDVALKEAQLNNNNNATTVASVSRAAAGSAQPADSQVSRAMDAVNSRPSGHSVASSCVTRSVLSGERASTHGGRDIHVKVQPSTSPSLVARRRAEMPTAASSSSSMSSLSSSSSSCRSDQHRRQQQRPLSVGTLEEVSLGRRIGPGASSSSSSSSSRLRGGNASRTGPQAARQFSLRLQRSERPPPRASASFEDPWLVRGLDPNRTSRVGGTGSGGLSPTSQRPGHQPSAIGQELAAGTRTSARSLRTEREALRTLSVERDCHEVGGGAGHVNNAGVSRTAPSSEVAGGGRGSRSPHPVPSPSVGRRPLNNRARSSTAPSVTATGPALNSTPHHAHLRPAERAGGRCPGSSPHSARRADAQPRETGRAHLSGSGRSLAEMGSPWIRKRMEERDQRREMSKSLSIPPSLSPRPLVRSLRQSSANWYSVPPALGPVVQDFASSQLASIAQHNKKQSKDILTKTAAISPSLKGDHGH